MRTRWQVCRGRTQLRIPARPPHTSLLVHLREALAGSLGILLLVWATLGWTPLAHGQELVLRSASANSTPGLPATASPVACRDAFEDDGIPARARPLVLGEPQAHLLCPAGDADWLTFFAHAGKGYDITTTQLGPG